MPTILSIINHHKALFGFPASWNYFETGHGKGPCDGVGGTSERMADQATKRNIKIQSAADFYSWASTTQTLVDYEFVSKDFCEEVNAQLKEYVFKPIPGTMKLHSVVSIGNGTLYTRELLCFCSECLDGNTFKFACPGWREWELPLNNRAIPNASTPTSQIVQNIDDDETRERSEVPESVASEDTLVRPVVDDHVAAVYEGDGE